MEKIVVIQLIQQTAAKWCYICESTYLASDLVAPELHRKKLENASNMLKKELEIIGNLPDELFSKFKSLASLLENLIVAMSESKVAFDVELKNIRNYSKELAVEYMDYLVQNDEENEEFLREEDVDYPY